VWQEGRVDTEAAAFTLHRTRELVAHGLVTVAYDLKDPSHETQLRQSCERLHDYLHGGVTQDTQGGGGGGGGIKPE
jgi:hypothetical protein